MIPESLFGLVMFVALLVPGFVYLERRERHHPGIDYSALRETSLVVMTSISSLTAVTLAFGVLRLVDSPTLPRVLIPDVGAYVQGGDDYARVHFVEAAIWMSTVVALASCLAAVCQWPS